MRNAKLKSNANIQHSNKNAQKPFFKKQPKSSTLNSKTSAIKSTVVQKKDGDRKAVRIQKSRAAYLRLVRTAILQINSKGLSDKTFSETIGPVLNDLSKPQNIVWRNSQDVDTKGKGASFSLRKRSKGRGSVAYKLIIDEGLGQKDFSGLHSSQDHTITLNKNKATSIDAIRRVLYHEAIHLIVSIIQNYGKSSVSDSKDKSLKSLTRDLNDSRRLEINKLLEKIRIAVNATRAKKRISKIPKTAVDRISRFLWEEISVRAETFYFELQIWLGQKRSSLKGLPSPGYMSVSGLKRYLKMGKFLTENDLKLMRDPDKELLKSLSKRLMYNQRALIKSRGVINAYIPHPLEPKTAKIVIGRPVLKLGPMRRLKPPKSFLDRISKDARNLDH